MRTIEVGGETYKYTIGKQFLKVHGFAAVPLHVLKGLCADDFDSARRQGSVSYGSVTPADVKAFIEENKGRN